MPDAIAQLLNEGKVQLFCADAVDGEGLLNGDLPQRRRAELQEKYFVYLTAELAPRILTLNNAKKGTRIWTAGVDLRLPRRPLPPAPSHPVCRCCGHGRHLRPDPLLGHRQRRHGAALLSPCLSAGKRHCQQAGIDQGRRELPDPLCRSGRYEGDALDDTQALADLLKDQGMPAHLEVWGGDVSHDWYWWGKMWSLFAPRILEVK
mgnify:CR=1 FL=1